MTEEHATRPSRNGSVANISPALAEGRSRLLLFGGMGTLGIAAVVDLSFVFWGGVAIVGLAFALNSAGKLSHYWGLSIPRNDRLKLSLSWLLLAVTVLALLANYGHARYGPGDGGFFWSLAVAGIGFGLLHMAAQSTYLPASEVPADDGNENGDG